MIDYIELDINSSIPKYLQIIDSIIHNIIRGNFKIGDKMPSISRLSEEFYISRDTVERAYNVLKKQKVIISVRGKGTYVAENHLVSKPKILFLVNKLSTYKMKVYNSFVAKMGENAQVDIHSYHCDESLFLDLMEKHKTSYGYYVIMPHFRTNDLVHTSFTEKVNKVLDSIPKENLVLLDNNDHQIKGDFVEVYQDYENNIYNALVKGKEKINKYSRLTLVYPKTSFYPYPKKILKGFLNYCADFNFDFKIIEEVSNEIELEKETLFITLEDQDLVNVVNKVKKCNYKLGEDVGVISYNDTPLKQLLGISVLSVNFDSMGEQAAEMILDNKKGKVKTPFNFIERSSI
jgi:DNA-binding transcriptional regulator YhcF (GntR family)